MRDVGDIGIAHLVDLELIGSGGFGTVYAGTDSRLDRRVAVKVLSRLRTGRDRQAFELECRIMGRMSAHPSVVTVHEAGFTRYDDPYLIMELADGSLADQLAATGPVPWARAVDYVLPVADALGFAHAQGIEHRDVKPENVLLAGSEPRLNDFGIARLRQVTDSGSTEVSASWLHAPPETLTKRRDHRADLYSLVSTLYTLITGRPPFWDPDDDSIGPVLFRLLHQPAPELPAHLGPPALARLVADGLAKDPACRPQTAAELIDRLVAVRGPRPVPLDPPPVPPADPTVTDPAPPLGDTALGGTVAGDTVAGDTVAGDTAVGPCPEDLVATEPPPVWFATGGLLPEDPPAAGALPAGVGMGRSRDDRVADLPFGGGATAAAGGPAGRSVRRPGRGRGWPEGPPLWPTRAAALGAVAATALLLWGLAATGMLTGRNRPARPSTAPAGEAALAGSGLGAPAPDAIGATTTGDATAGATTAGAADTAATPAPEATAPAAAPASTSSTAGGPGATASGGSATTTTVATATGPAGTVAAPPAPVGSPGTEPRPPATPFPVAGATSWGHLQPGHDRSKCLDVPNFATLNNVAVDQWDCVAQTNENWRFEPAPGQGANPVVFLVRNQFSQKCLTVLAGSTSAGAPVVQFDCTTVNGNGQWTVLPGSGGWLLRNRTSGLCLTVEGASTLIGTDLVQAACAPPAAAPSHQVFTAADTTGLPT